MKQYEMEYTIHDGTKEYRIINAMDDFVDIINKNMKSKYRDDKNILFTPVYGYKAFDKDLKGRDKQYDFGITYLYNDNVELYKSGYHFDSNIKDIFKYYPIDSRICIVKASNATLMSRNNARSIYATNTLELISEIEVSKIDRVRYSLYNTLSNISNWYCDTHDGVLRDSDNTVILRVDLQKYRMFKIISCNISEDVSKTVDNIINSLSKEEIDKIYNLYIYNSEDKVIDRLPKDIVRIKLSDE